MNREKSNMTSVSGMNTLQDQANISQYSSINALCQSIKHSNAKQSNLTRYVLYQSSLEDLATNTYNTKLDNNLQPSLNFTFQSSEDKIFHSIL